MTLTSNSPHVLWSHSDIYETPQRLHDSRDDWKGDLKTKTYREPLAKVENAIVTKPTNAELYQKAMKQLEKESFDLAEIYVVKTPLELPKKRAIAPPARSITPLTIILVAACIIGILIVLNILRRIK